MKKELYVANPLGFSESGREFLYNKLLPIISSQGYGILDPWVLTSQSVIEKAIKLPISQKKVNAWRRANKIIGANNEDAIRRAYGIVAVVDGMEIDSGTASEIGFGYGLGKPILGYRGDFRSAGDNIGSVINLQVEHFISHSPKGRIVFSLEEVSKNLEKVFGKPNY